MKKINRRHFLRQIGCTGMGATAFFSSYNNLSLINKLIGTSLTPPNDYKALVCILLAGGNDSYNMLVPRGNDEYAEYAATRSDLALPQNELLPINPIMSDGKEYGVHPSMGGVQQMFEDGNLAFLSNVGTLVEPIPDSTAFFNGALKRPLGLYSHSDQIQQWQTSIPQSREAIGWGGRMADLLKTLNTNQNISMNISLSGRNVYQSGNTVMEYSISNRGDGVEGIQAMVPSWYSDSGYLNRLRDDVIEDMSTEVYMNIFQQTFGDLTKQTLDTFEDFQNAVSTVQLNTPFSPERLSQDLRQVARVIAARDALGMSRQTFFISYGGWDHHNEVLNAQLYKLGVVNNAISEFYSALGEINMQDQVTLFTVSDFARTLTSNGNGSDHAWGGNSIVAGGAVNGKEIYGSFPDLYLNDNPLVVSSRGNFIPTTSTDELFAELALWFGVSPNDLHLILPNIAQFYDTSSGLNPLGILS